jgi:predicted enzyme related to lactoylglutathione lyase
MGRVVHFEVQVDQPQRAMDFYRKVFDWEFERWGQSEFWLIRTGPSDEPGINGALLRRRGSNEGGAMTAYVCTIDVDSVDESAKLIGSSGGQVVVPKTSIRGVGHFVYCKDTEGNVFGMMEANEAAG